MDSAPVEQAVTVWTVSVGRRLDQLAVGWGAWLLVGSAGCQLAPVGPLNRLPTDANWHPIGAGLMVNTAPYFEGAESISGPGLAKIPGVRVVLG